MPKVLVAEDEPALAQFYEVLLTHWNCETVVEPGIKLLEICPGTKIVLVSDSVTPEMLEQLAAQGYHFDTLTAPFSHEDLHAVVFGGFEASP